LRGDRAATIIVMLVSLGLLHAGPASCESSAERPTVSPRSSLFMSAVLPGWGQVANGHPMKGAVCFAAGAGLLGRILIEGRRADLALERARASTDNAEYLHYYGQYADHFGNRDDAVWWAVFFWLYAMLDAYVDAHLVGFDEEFDGEPQGNRLKPWAEATADGVRFGLRIGG
jgi:hypothetical protein